MSRSYWLPIIALGGWLISPALGQSPNPEGVTKKPPAVKTQTKNNAARKQYPTEESPLPVREVQSPPDAEHTKDRETKSDAHDAADLDAQIRSADAVEKQVAPTTATAWLTFAGTVLLIWNLVVARGANRISQDTAKHQLRAYLGTIIATDGNSKGFDWDKFGRFIGPQVGYRNFGQTPASNVTCVTRAKVLTETESAANEWNVEQPLGMDSVIHPGDIITRMIVIDDPNGPIQQGVCECRRRGILEGTHVIWIWGRVEYADIYGDPHVTNFRYFIDKVSFKRGVIHPAPKGNSAT